MQIKPIIDSFAKLITEPNSPDFSTRKKIAAWAVSILVFVPFGASLHLFSYFWNRHRIKHAPDAAPKVNQVYQHNKPKNPEPPKQQRRNSLKPIQGAMQANPNPAQKPLDSAAQNLKNNNNHNESPNMYVGQRTYPYNPLNRTQGLNPIGGNPSTKMVDINGLKDEKRALEILANAGTPDTYFLFDSDQVNANVQKVFNDYLLNANDHNLKKNGAYFLVSWHSDYDASVYYHYLIKALQDKGKDVYFVVLRGPFTETPNASRIVSQGIQVEDNQNDKAWHPYYLNVEISHLTYEVSELKTMNSPTGPFTKFPRITGWTRETETFSWRGNQAVQNSPKPAAPAPSPNPQRTPVMPITYSPAPTVQPVTPKQEPVQMKTPMTYPLAPPVQPVFPNPSPKPQPYHLALPAYSAMNRSNVHTSSPVTMNPAPQTKLPSRKMIGTKELDNPAAGIELAKKAENADTYFFYHPNVLPPEEFIPAFENYLNESKDKNLCKKGAYIINYMSERFDQYVYYHYLIKALQEKGLDVYFVTLFRNTPRSSNLIESELSKGIEIEGNRNDFYRPYHIRFIRNPKGNVLNMYEFPDVITSMPADYKPNDQFAPIPKIIGWSRETETFTWFGNQT